ncbi:peptidoglycan-binding protein [Halalkalibacterium halodurans]|uniref:peptidoglycan-binding protein n=1 Tax=Halalkalibacterium halodurans TaxID=86665 RepID=UPI002AAA07CC|nr:peptidoglycan-binding protein [Halalkalibacterium halodurans]MDY7224138.1 peptidoglycan-binding protein [Halalkalibacterium halodurans]MDY7243423.1 peptidoglycan-binding protein [Halalkalibacterium halodurans]
MRFHKFIVFCITLLLSCVLWSNETAQAQVLKLGTYDTAVIQLKIDLEKAGFKVSDNPTTYFGPTTEQKVKEFQQAYGLTVDGIAGPATLSKLEEVVRGTVRPATLRFGDRHPYVIQLKKDLAEAGFPVSGSPTEYFGSVTESQVKAFQRAHGLTANGVVESATYAKLDEVLNGNSRPATLRFGDRHPYVIQLKKDLAEAGFPVSGSPTEYFGSVTESQVKAFQRAHGLTANGVVESATYAKLDEVLNGNSRPATLRFGDRHPYVIQLKKDLAEAGFPVSGSPTEYFGSVTESQVKAFQRAYGLTVDGIVGSATYAKLDEVLKNGTGRPSTLRFGDRHPYVIQLKKDLAEVGFPVSGSPTEYFGSVTESQVKAFQRAYGLTADGIVGSATYSKLDEVLLNGTTLPSNKALSGRTIVVDPGHGGSDPGAIANGLQEKVVALDISKRLETKLKAQGATVIMTRSTDVYPSLTDRVNIANSSGADAFISIHLNAATSTSANGTETYWNSAHAATSSRSLATNIQQELVRAINTNNRGVKEANFQVIRDTRIPSVLVEVGFLTNPTEANRMKSASFLDSAAEGILNGTIKHFN